MELPLVIDARHKDWLKVFKPADAMPLVENQFLITVQEDLEKVPLFILTRLYNQANPGLNVTAFKPGTILKYCFPSLIKLADKLAVDGQPTAAEGAKVSKRDIPDKYRKGDKEATLQEGSLRKQAYDLALNEPAKLDPKLKVIVNGLVRDGLLVKEQDVLSPTVVAAAAAKTKGKAREGSLSSVITSASAEGRTVEEINALAIAHPKYKDEPKKAINYVKAYLKYLAAQK